MRYRTWGNIKFFVGVFFQLLLAAAVIIVGWSMSSTSIDLNQTPQSVGVISSTNAQQSKGSKALPGIKDLVVYINTDVNGFWIYRSSQNYSPLISKLSIGDTIKIYHSDNVGSNDYYTAYQIEKGKEIIYSVGEYGDKEKFAGRFITLPLGILILGITGFQIKKRYKKK